MSPSIDSTRFSLELVKKLYRPGQNLVLSPYSFTSGLVMLIAGASGNTRTELLKVMFGEKAPDGPEGDKLVKALAEANKAIFTRNPTLKVANLLYADQSILLKPDYLSILTEQMNATVKRLDFNDGLVVAVKVINSDVSDGTSGLIDTAIDRIEPDSALLLVNAIYFKDVWSSPFDKTIENGDFRTLSGKVVKTTFMHKRSQSIKFDQDGRRYKAVQLDYQDKGNLAMVLILPKEGVSIDTYLKTQLTFTSLEKILRSFRTCFDVTLSIPRFKLTSSNDLKKPLTELGVTDWFDEAQANFTHISHNHRSRPPCVSQIVQKAVIEVNEEGTKAASVKYHVSGNGIGQPQVEFIANRPFIFALVTKSSISAPRVLSIGVVEDPTKN